MSHPHLLTLTLDEPDTVFKYEGRVVTLIHKILECSDKAMIKSLDNFNRILELLLSYDNTFTIEYVQDIIFFISCSSYPSVTIFMLKNGLYTKTTLTTFYSKSYRTPFHEVVINNNDLLIKHFGRIEYFGELLVLTRDDDDYPPIYLISPDNPTMMKSILESEYCTEHTLKIRMDSNIFGYYYSQNNYNVLEQLLESEKFTSECIVSPYANGNRDLDKIMNSPLFGLVVKSNKLPIDFFVGNEYNFYGPLSNINLFLDSQYCNINIVEEFINKYPYKTAHKSQYESALTCILLHPKYSHLSEKYNCNGTVKHDYGQIDTVDGINERFDEMNNVIKALQREVQILKLEIEKMKLEKDMRILE